MRFKRTFTISFALSFVLFAGLFVFLVNTVGRGVCTSDSWIPKALQYKRALCQAIHEPKIVVIGGSEAYFSTDSELLSRQTGMPVVNMATHIGIPVRMYPNILEGVVSSGDVVVYSLAFNGQHNCGEEKLYSSLAMPMYWNGLYPEMQSALSLPELVKLYFCYGVTWISDSLAVAEDKRQRPSENILEEYSQLHDEQNNGYMFYTSNSHGDKLYAGNAIDYHELMKTFHLLSCKVTDEFVDSLNRLRRHLSERGVTLTVVLNNIFYYPLWTTVELQEFDHALRLKGIGIDCQYEALSFPANYYFDTRLHMNKRGARLLTYELAKTVNRALCRANPDIPDWPVTIFAENPSAVTTPSARRYLTGVAVSGDSIAFKCRIPENLRNGRCVARLLMDRFKPQEVPVVRSVAVNGKTAAFDETARRAKNEVDVYFEAGQCESAEFTVKLLKHNAGVERVILEKDNFSVYDFHSVGANFRMEAGFAAPSEKYGAWSLGTQSVMRLRMRRADECARIAFDLQLYAVPNKVVVRTGGQELATWTFDKAGKCQRDLLIPAAAIPADGWVTLDFEAEKTYCPHRETGSSDTRELCLLFIKAEQADSPKDKVGES